MMHYSELMLTLYSVQWCCQVHLVLVVRRSVSLLESL